MRHWLLYAHSPLEDRHNLGIRLPEFGDVKVPQAGAFYLVDEHGRKPVERLRRTGTSMPESP